MKKAETPKRSLTKAGSNKRKIDVPARSSATKKQKTSASKSTPSKKRTTPSKRARTTPSKSAKKGTPKARSSARKTPQRSALKEKISRDKAMAPKWNIRDRKFKSWSDEFVFDLVRETLSLRGWTDLGDLCNPHDMNELNAIARQDEEYNGKKIKRHTRRCLWWVHEDDARRLKELPEEKNPNNARHVISTWMGTDAAVTKIAVTDMNNHEPWYPTAYVLPRMLPELKKAIKKKDNTYWIAKPRNDYGGKNMTVFEGNMKEFKELINTKESKEFVVQKYIPNPILLGGYKFHFRMYTILTGVLDNFECYLHKAGTVLFSTEPYSNDIKYMGNNQNEFMHLTNWSINFAKNNIDRLKANKPVIGEGCEWDLKKFMKEFKKTYPKFDEDDFWKQMAIVNAKSMYRIAQWKHVKRCKKDNNKHPRFENFGVDLIMDDNFKIWLLESNTQVGLNPQRDWFPDVNCKAEKCIKNGCEHCRGFKNKGAKRNNDVMRRVVNGTIDLMQLDVPANKRVPKDCIPLHPLIDLETINDGVGTIVD